LLSFFHILVEIRGRKKKEAYEHRGQKGLTWETGRGREREREREGERGREREREREPFIRNKGEGGRGVVSAGVRRERVGTVTNFFVHLQEGNEVIYRGNEVIYRGNEVIYRGNEVI